ncbi:hypothetical protein W97_05536 [Coniosporium apollinis CBS 100218]|uniref:Uncharacterized protein n=1 Tax=Coniosporium apollinis (strain CBS 100218) TaxID=1168221 RepID=R7YX68_CONA1|nr:uncharacterized protein W97_05536 [Coniosporium apollinis CBS 100218]EON66438.1 hypothetical protein W97_05536 [Coniosporium apollinis CBS 100218]
MAVRPLLTVLKTITTTALRAPSHPPISLSRASYSSAAPRHAPAHHQPQPQSHPVQPPPTAAEVVTSIHGEADRNEAAEIEALFRPPPEALDSTKSAFLGEADSNDFVEAEDAVNPRKLEALDASASAYLGEADSNDAVEGDRVINPRDPEPVDPTVSAFHGESGEQDAYEKP